MSKVSGIRKWRSLFGYHIYRIFSFLLLTAFWLAEANSYNDLPILALTIIYGLFSVIAFVGVFNRWPKFRTQVIICGIVDMVSISLYVTYLDQLQSGLGILLNVNIAILSLLVPGRIAIFFAAIGSVMLLGICSWEYIFLNKMDSSIFFYSGIHGAGLFATAIVAWFLAKRVEIYELLAKQRGSELADVQEINQYIVERLRAGAIYASHDGKIQLINSSAKAIFGLKNTTMPRNLADLSPILNLSFASYIKKQSHQSLPKTVVIKRLSIRAQYLPILNNERAAFLIILEDIRLIAQQAQQLKLASLGRFTASVAHELRNPLGAISHAVQLMGNSGLSKEDIELKAMIEKHCNRMNDVIKNVLQLSRREKSHPQLIDLRQLLMGFIEDYQQYQPCQFELDIQTNENINIIFDQTQLEQILVILCDNAVKHNHQSNKKVTIRFTLLFDLHKFQLSILDNGDGIDPKYEQQLFEPFFTTSHEGHGMGLFIAKELCEVNNALLRYNKTKKGCCFVIEFGQEEVSYYE